VFKESASAEDVLAAMPHPVVGSAADPIALKRRVTPGTWKGQMTSTGWPESRP
jgi:hypothetical protein